MAASICVRCVRCMRQTHYNIIIAKLDAIQRRLGILTGLTAQIGATTMADLSRLESDVAAQTSVVASVQTLLAGWQRRSRTSRTASPTRQRRLRSMRSPTRSRPTQRRSVTRLKRILPRLECGSTSQAITAHENPWANTAASLANASPSSPTTSSTTTISLNGNFSKRQPQSFSNF